MKRVLICLVVVIAAITTASAQISTAGLVAQWKFNGNTNDSSGNGLHGTPHHITYTQNIAGDSNRAALFNGDSSYVEIPYHPSMNVKQFSICATVKLNDFYRDLCEANYIFTRGENHRPGSYILLASDNAYDTVNCGHLDTTQHVFYSTVDNKAIDKYTHIKYKYTPTILLDEWYCVISTFNGDTNKIYVNGILKSVVVLSSDTMRTSTDGISIGANRFGNYALYPYWVDGVIDEVRLYNRALSQEEIPSYCLEVEQDTIAKEDTTTSISYINSLQKSLNVYPNPAKDDLHISGYANGASTSITILNTLGQTVLTTKVDATNSNFNTSVSIRHLPTGAYIVKVVSGNQIGTKMFILRE